MTARARAGAARPLPDAHDAIAWSCGGRAPNCTRTVLQGAATFVYIATADGGRLCTARCPACSLAERTAEGAHP